jgi:glycosyltransferase EpsE
MDGDDIALPNRLKQQVVYLDEHPDIGVVGGAVQIYDGKKITGIRYCKVKPLKNDVLMGPPFIHPTIMMRKKIYDELNGYAVLSRTQRGQDWDLWFRFFAADYHGANLQDPVLIYHESPKDYKKITFKAAIDYTRTAIKGYKLMGVPTGKYILTLRPILSYFIPERIKKQVRGENSY